MSIAKRWDCIIKPLLALGIIPVDDGNRLDERHQNQTMARTPRCRVFRIKPIVFNQPPFSVKEVRIERPDGLGRRPRSDPAGEETTPPEEDPPGARDASSSAMLRGARSASACVLPAIVIAQSGRASTITISRCCRRLHRRSVDNG